ncbi:hypothetical protein K1719_038171 [Acacia pycnantha]|nr:hypothetical protein K1719_038171 [Acacia pycnantha]
MLSRIFQLLGIKFGKEYVLPKFGQELKIKDNIILVEDIDNCDKSEPPFDKLYTDNVIEEFGQGERIDVDSILNDVEDNEGSEFEIEIEVEGFIDTTMLLGSRYIHPFTCPTTAGVSSSQADDTVGLSDLTCLICDALPYVNNVPHLGNIIGSVLSADVFARYCRIRGYNAIYICGTDEYGTATETKAMEEKCSPKEICDKYYVIHKERLLDNECLSENTMQQLYCDKCQRFLADRLVEGTCPTPGCEYDSARGDQCEKCGKLLNPTELKNPRCKVCQNTPRIRDTNHLFLELPLLKDKLEKYINKMSVEGLWSQNAIQTTNSWLREGLKPRCITRDLKWGVPVPHEKYSDKVFYVWFDAPIGYCAIPHCDVPLYFTQTGFSFFCFLGKFSKSKGIGVFGNDVKDTNIPVEVWRYYLLTNRPEVILFLAINRVLSFVAKPSGLGYDSIIPSIPADQYIEAMEKVKLKQGLKLAMSISGEGNGYLQETEFWRLYKENQPLCALVMKTAVGVVYLLACLLEPFMPSFTLEVFKQLNLPSVVHDSLCDEKGDVDRVKRPWEIISAGHKIGTPQPLFKELKDEEVEFYRKKFAGSQADRIERAEAEAGKLADQLKKTKVSEGSGKKNQSTKSLKEGKTKGCC